MSTYSPEILNPALQREARDFDERNRLYNDMTTWLAEVVPGQMRTSFEFEFDGQDIRGSDGGALTPIFDKSIADAERITRSKPELHFEVDRRRTERGELDDMFDMLRGDKPNTMVVISDFPDELRAATKDIGGYNIARQQTMLRVITVDSSGKLLMRSQSLDRSDRQALEAIYGHLGFVPQSGELLGQRMHLDMPPHEQEFLIDWLVGVYDRTMTSNYGGEWYAGRTPAEVQNTYDFVRAQDDLIQAYIRQTMINGADESMRYGLAAAMVKRFKLKSGVQTSTAGYYVQEHILNEIGAAGNEAMRMGIVFSGCGATSGPDGLNDSEGQLSELGFGNPEQTDKYGSLTFKCPKGHTNTRPRGRLIERCQTCHTSVRC